MHCSSYRHFCRATRIDQALSEVLSTCEVSNNNDEEKGKDEDCPE